MSGKKVLHISSLLAGALPLQPNDLHVPYSCKILFEDL